MKKKVLGLSFIWGIRLALGGSDFASLWKYKNEMEKL